MSPLSTSLSLRFTIFYMNVPATPEIYTLSLHDALPICPHTGDQAVDRAVRLRDQVVFVGERDGCDDRPEDLFARDRKSTRLNSSHVAISYAVFCLKKKNEPRTRS